MSRSIGEFEQLLLLAVLRLKEEAYGVTIRRAVQEATGRNIAAGAVYTALGRLEGRGFVTASDGEPSPERTGMKRRYYKPIRFLQSAKSMILFGRVSWSTRTWV